jgi:hypothetical protein
LAVGLSSTIFASAVLVSVWVVTAASVLGDKVLPRKRPVEIAKTEAAAIEATNRAVFLKALILPLAERAGAKVRPTLLV